jgi:N-acetylmuramic acid 6-phosphate etherase
MLLTEQPNPHSQDIDRRSTLDMLLLMNDEDAGVAQVVRAALPQVAQAVDAIVAGIQSGGRLIYVGAGTSGRLAILDAAECPPTYNTPPELVQAIIAGGAAAVTGAVEGAEDNTEAGRADLLALNISPQDIVVGIAASGRTPYVLAALETANDIGAITVGVSCNRPAPLLDLAQIKIALPVGPEVVTGSTRLKAGTAQKWVLNMLTTGSMIRLGKVYDNWMVDLRVSNTKLAARARRIVSEIAGVSQDEAAQLLAQTENEVKTAIVIAKKSITPEQARAALSVAKGRLREVIG